MFYRQRRRRRMRQWMRQALLWLCALGFALKNRWHTAHRERDEEAQQCAEAEASQRGQEHAESLHGCDWPDGPLSPTGVRW